jgi:hypothetical protein
MRLRPVDMALRRIAERLRPCCGTLTEAEIEELATELFLEGARFGLAWVEASASGTIWQGGSPRAGQRDRSTSPAAYQP